MEFSLIFYFSTACSNSSVNLFQIVAPEDSYLTNMKSEEAAITVQTKTEPKLTVSVILTSPLLREQVNAAGSGKVLPSLLLLHSYTRRIKANVSTKSLVTYQ